MENIRITRCTYIFKAALFTIPLKWKQSECPAPGERIDKMGYVHMMGCYLAIKWNEMFIKKDNIEEPQSHEAN